MTADHDKLITVGASHKSPCEVVERVRNELLTRSQVGLQKYGMTLSDNPASRLERLNHALQEACDLANYLMWEIMKEEENERNRRACEPTNG